MFPFYKGRQSIIKVPKQKQVHFLRNGYPDKIFIYKFSKPLRRDEICKQCQKQWSNYKWKNIKLYTAQGVQLLDEDLFFVRDNDRIYVSRGEQFDSNRNFGEYQQMELIGQGGFGKVFKGKNTITNDIVAIKVIKLEKISDTNDIDMIFREIESLKTLNHSNIVKIINCYTLQNMQAVMIMEYMEGGELLKMLKQNGVFSQEIAKKIFEQIISAINYCHNQNIVHRDLKLENILISNKKEMKVKLGDFGISGMTGEINPNIDSGTLRYMAPEVLSGKQKSNTSGVDIWACGIVLYYMLYGYMPFTGSTTTQVIQQIISGKFHFPDQPFVSKQCKQLILKLLEPNPKKRIRAFQIESDPWLFNPAFCDKKLNKLNQVVLNQANKIPQKQSNANQRPSKYLLPKRFSLQKYQSNQQNKKQYALRSTTNAFQQLPLINSTKISKITKKVIQNNSINWK